MTIAANMPTTGPSDCAFLLLTQSCNLRCTHCYVEAGPAVGQHMPLPTVEAALDMLARLGVDDVRLTGGEPTIHPHFVRIVHIARERGIRLGMASNGVKLLNDERAGEVLGAFARCWISVYGVSAEGHRRTSGRTARTFDDTVAKIGSLTGQGCWIGLSALASPGDSQYIDSLMEAACQAGVTKLRILPIQPDGRASGALFDWEPWPNEVRQIASRMHSHRLASKFEVLTINDPFDVAERFTSAQHSCLIHSRRMWSITPDGSIYPCCFTVYAPALQLGSVHDSEIAGRLAALHKPHGIASACHGLKRAFWPGVKVTTITCPIGSFDPRSLTGTKHAST